MMKYHSRLGSDKQNVSRETITVKEFRTMNRTERRKLFRQQQIEWVRDDALYSDEDNLMVVWVRCYSCQRHYEDSLIAVTDKVLTDSIHLCISCDPEAEEAEEAVEKTTRPLVVHCFRCDRGYFTTLDDAFAITKGQRDNLCSECQATDEDY